MIAIKIAITVKLRWDGQDRGKIEFRLRKCEKIKIVKIRSKYRLSPSKTHNQYKEELKVKNPDIKVLGIYAGARTKIAHQCMKCGRIWDAAPTNLLRGHGCTCDLKKPLDPDSFNDLLKNEMPTVKIIQKPPFYKDDLFVECKVCGYQWHSNYSSLITAHKGCIFCGRKRIGNASRLSEDDFRAKLEKINPNVSPLDCYEGSKKKIHFKCNICDNIWEQTPNTILNGHGCPVCASNRKRITKQEFEIKLKDTSYVLISEFTKASDVMKFQCSVCNSIIELDGLTALRGKQCRTCYNNNRIEDHAYVLDKIQEQLLGEYEILEDYKGFHEPIKILKIDCGHVWYASPNLIRDYSNYCPICKEISIKESREEKINEFLRNTDVEILDYHYSDDKILFRCKECGNEWTGTYYNVIVSGRRCPNCIGRHISESLKHSHEEFVSQIFKINPHITVLGKYKKATEKIEVQCNICNFIWSPVANSLIQGCGCPKCNRPHGEVKIGNYLDKNKIPYEAQKKFPELGRLSYDFYLPVQNLLIEFQGKQHYQPIKHFGGEEAFIKQQERDTKKRKYAQEHNINLLEIKYNENVNDVLEKYLYNLNSKSVETVIPA